MEMSKQMEQQIAEFQTLQNQLQMIVLQKQQVRLQLDENEQASEELKNAKGHVYKVAGTILIESKKEEVEKTLLERKETLDLRISMLAKQEEKLRKRLEEMQSKLESELKPRAGGS